MFLFSLHVRQTFVKPAAHDACFFACVLVNY